MNSHVDFQPGRRVARVVALRTNKGFLSAVNSHVGFQPRRCMTRIAALIAIVSFLSIRVKIVGIMLSCHLEFSGNLVSVFSGCCLLQYLGIIGN